MTREQSNVAILASLVFLSGCPSMPDGQPKYPVGQSGAITSIAQLEEAVAEADGNKGVEIRLAGRIQGIEPTAEGYHVLATWLPYPASFRMATPPRDSALGEPRHFTFYFYGKPTSDFRVWRGNKFILEGTVEGKKKTVIDVIGRSQTLLSVRANCVHVWETGQSDAVADPDSQYEARARTFCARKSK